MTTAFEDALQRFDQLLDKTPIHILQEHRGHIQGICKKLNKSKGGPVLCLLDALESSRKTVEDYTNLPVKRAVARSVKWEDIDLRVHDIRLGCTRHDNVTKFRKGLGERALALHYHEWEMQEFRCSTLSKMCKDPGNYKNVDGNIGNFIAAFDLPQLECVEKGIRHGTKLLLFESLVGMRGTSAILFFAFGKFREVKYPEMKRLAELMRTHLWLFRLIQKIEPWFEKCWAVYEGNICNFVRINLHLC